MEGFSTLKLVHLFYLIDQIKEAETSSLMHLLASLACLWLGMVPGDILEPWPAPVLHKAQLGFQCDTANPPHTGRERMSRSQFLRRTTRLSPLALEHGARTGQC